MPDIQPSAGDLVEVSVHVGMGKTDTLLAKIAGRNAQGHFQVVLDGEPNLSGIINIADYCWLHETGRWERKPESERKPKPGPAEGAKGANANRQAAE